MRSSNVQSVTFEHSTSWKVLLCIRRLLIVRSASYDWVNYHTSTLGALPHYQTSSWMRQQWIRLQLIAWSASFASAAYLTCRKKDSGKSCRIALATYTVRPQPAGDLAVKGSAYHPGGNPGTNLKAIPTDATPRK